MLDAQRLCRSKQVDARNFSVALVSDDSRRRSHFGMAADLNRGLAQLDDSGRLCLPATALCPSMIDPGRVLCMPLPVPMADCRDQSPLRLVERTPKNALPEACVI